MAGVVTVHAETQSISENNSTGLVKALQTALKYNPAMRGQLSQVKVQEYAVDVAKAGRYPSMSISGDNMDDDYTEATLVINQPLWSFGKIDSAIGLAQANYQVETQGLLQVKRELLVETATAYAQVQSARQKIQVAELNVAEHQSLYQRIKRRKAAQLASVTDVNLANSRLLQAESDLLSYQGELKTSNNELYALTMKSVATVEPIDGALITLPNAQEVMALAVKESADLAYASEQVNVSKMQLSQQQAAPLPTLSLRLQKSLLETDPGDDVDRTQFGLVIEGQFDGMGVASFKQMKGAAEQINAAKYQLDSARNEVLREVKNLLVNRQWLDGVRESQRRTQQALEVTMESYFRQYESNRKSWVEALNSQRELTQMRYSLIGSEYQWMVLSLQLSALIGQLDSFAEVNQE